MTTKEKLLERSKKSCELCGSKENLDIFKVEPKDEYVLICDTCKKGIESTKNTDTNHWRCLNDAMWSEIPAVQILSYRILKSISEEGWPQDMLDMMYLNDDMIKWANANQKEDDTEKIEPTLDSNGTILNSGDNVTIIKDLDVKGAGFTAKRGTVVKNIFLTDNPERIEGKVNGVKIVLISKFLKKI